MHDGVVVNAMDDQPIGQGFKSKPLQKAFLDAYLTSALCNSAIMSKHCQWEARTAMESTGYPPSYAETKK